MKLRRFLVSFFLSLVASVHAQNPQGNSGGNSIGIGNKPAPNTPEAAWAAVTDLAKPVSIPKTDNGNPKSKEQIGAEITQQTARSRQAAQAARDFYTANPGHAKASEARKVEALSAIRGVEAGNAGHEQAARTAASVFRADKAQSVADRFDVALAMERLELSLKIKNRTATGRTEEWKKLGDGLKIEFGDTPALHDYMMDVARSADLATAARMASEVKLSATASPGAKARAQAAIDRAAILGKRIDVKFDKVGGGQVDLGRLDGKPTVVLISTPGDNTAQDPVRRIEHAVAKDTQFVYLVVGGTTAQINRLKASVTIPATFCSANAASATKQVIDGLKLQHAQTPCFYTFNKLGVVAGIGRIEDFVALQAAALR